MWVSRNQRARIPGKCLLVLERLEAGHVEFPFVNFLAGMKIFQRETDKEKRAPPHPFG